MGGRDQVKTRDIRMEGVDEGKNNEWKRDVERAKI